MCRIAGLIHDIGHGPFSHLYDHQVKPSTEPEHEERGIEIFTEMWKKYNLEITEEELCMIKTMIMPPDSYLKHHWYYQIIANKVCDIDVDKIDYIERDCFHTGLGFGGEWSRLLTMCNVRKLPNKEIKTITWSYKLKDEIFQLFAARYRLHKHVCTHHTVKAYEYVIVEILKIARSKTDTFMDLTDSVVTCRLHKEYRVLQEKLASKDIPLLVGEINVDDKGEGPNPRIVVDLIIDKVEIGLSSGDTNPLYNVLYENRVGEVEYMKKEDMGLCMPQKHKETIMRMYTTQPSRLEEARTIWQTWPSSHTL